MKRYDDSLDDAIRLVPVSRERVAEFAEMVDEWKAGVPSQAYGSIFAVALTDIDGYFALVEGLREGRGPIPNLVPSGIFWIEARGVLAGTINLRYELNERLMNVGGNIGYSVRPSARGCGLAQRGLRLALDILRERGTNRALLTCNDDNVVSAHIIEKAGGKRIADVLLENGILERRYWVSTTTTTGKENST
jgi:predicted acetyltransferase